MKVNAIKRFLPLLAAATLTLTGCGDLSFASDDGVIKVTKNYVDKLEEDTFYVRHTNNEGEIECTPTYFGNGTFDEETTPSSPVDTRVLWYSDDFDKIPTLYKGDSLIMYTTDRIDERINFERFEDYGYTIGLCGLEELKSGRYQISTDKNKKCTYPYGDTDELLKLNNETVILESIADIKTRAHHDTDEDTSTFLTRSGTIRNLGKEQTFKFVIYEGTIYHEYYFTSNIRALGSMEVATTYDYEFEQENLLRVNIPEYFNSGYYLINGKGLFRYVNDSSFSENTDFNIANVKPGENEDEMVTQIDLNSAREFNPESETGEKASTFSIAEAGLVNVKVTFTIPGNYREGDGLEDVTAIIQRPNGGTVHMITNADGSCSRSFDAEAGTYTIVYYNIDIREPHVSVVAGD